MWNPRRLVFISYALSSVTFADVSLISALPFKNINSIGKICEELAFIAYKDVFNEKKYTVLKNIVYGMDVHKKRKKKSIGLNVLGELDVVVLDNQHIVAVGEVKCSSPQGIAKAKVKAIAQMERFTNACSKKKCGFWDGTNKIELHVPDDPEELRIGYVSWKGSNQGFMELEETYEELEHFLEMAKSKEE